MKFHTAHAIAVLLCQIVGGCFASGADPVPTPVPPPAIVFPNVEPPPPPPMPVSPSTRLPSDVFYVISSEAPFLAVASPPGLLTVTHDAGPIKVRGRFVEDPSKVVTREFKAKYLVFVEAVGSGNAELLVWPTDTLTEKGIIHRLVEANNAPIPPPPPPPNPDPEPKPPPPPPVADLVKQLQDAYNADGDEDKANSKMLLTKMFREALARDWSSLRTVREADRAIRDASFMLLGGVKIPKLRDAIGAYLRTQMPTKLDTPFDAALQTKLRVAITALTNALDGVK